MVSSSKYALWTVFTQAGSSSPRRESSFAQARVVAQARKPLEQVCSLECFHLGEKSFPQAMRYSRPGESIFAKAKKRPCALDYFRLSDKFFRSGEGYFRPGETGLAQAKKKN